MNETTITLGDREFTLKPLAIRPAREWRKFCQERVQPHFDRLTERGKGRSVGEAMPLIQQTLEEAEDDILEALIGAIPALAEEREWLQDNCSGQDLLNGYREVTKVNFPLGMRGLLDILSGPARTETSTSLPSPNGDSAEKKQKRGGRKKSETATTSPTLSVTAGKRAS
jgi:hypothetical protein